MKPYLAARCGLTEARPEATTGSFAGVICSIDLPLTWTKLSSRAASSAFTASFTRRARDEVSEESFEIGLLGGDHAVEIFREQRRERLRHRKSHAFANGLGRPAVEQIPERAFARLVIHARDAQLGQAIHPAPYRARPVKRCRPALPAASAFEIGPSRRINSKASQASGE